jgi:cytochrome P450
MTDTAVFFNPFAEGYAANPYPHYAELREADPVHQTPLGAWYLFRYEDVRAFLRDPSHSVEDRNAHPTVMTEMAQAALGDQADLGNQSMLSVDAPQHTRLRRLVSKAFTPRMIEQLRPRIQQVVDEALDAAAWDGGFELMDGLAFHLPFTVITELLGMPPTDTVELRRLSGLLVRTLEPVLDPALMTSIAEAGREMDALIRSAIEWKRGRPGNDLLSALIAAEEVGDRLSESELVEQVTLLYIAGHETTVNLIGNGVLALLRHPDQMMLLRTDPSFDAPAVEELLRYDSPVQMTRRITMSPVAIGGKVIEPGAFVVLGLASANRDPERWGPTADNVDLRRADAGEHLSFGGGHHHCLGAALARLEGQVAIGSLVRRFAVIEATSEPEWNGRLNLRGLNALALRVRPA